MSDKVKSAFETFLQAEKLVGAKLLLMVSGGVDSVVLLHVAAQILPVDTLAVFHLNHNARTEAKQNQNFVQNLCSRLKVKYYTEQLSSPQKNQSNQEAAWRQIRQTLSQKIVRDFKAERVLTAHHATDLAETMIFRLTKGAGPTGLAPFDTSTKPFWQLPKQALIDYAQAHQLTWQEDDSNMNTKFERNLIRHKVIPPLRTITPNLEKVFVRESEIFASQADFIHTTLKTQCAVALSEKQIKLTDFLALHACLQNEFLRSITQKPVSQSELEDTLKWLHNNPQGNTKKSLGGAKLKILKNSLTW